MALRNTFLHTSGLGSGLGKRWLTGCPSTSSVGGVVQPVVCLLLWMFPLLFFLGCGVKVSVPSSFTTASSGDQGRNTQAAGSLSLSAAALSLLSGQSDSLSVATVGIAVTSVSLTVSCNAPDCGTATLQRYTAPSVTTQTTVTIVASSSVPGVVPSSLTLMVFPPIPPQVPPSITAVSPAIIAAGTTQRLVVTGVGFTSSDRVTVSGSLGNATVAVGAINVTAATSITISVTTSTSVVELLTISVLEPAPSSVSSQAIVTVMPTNTLATGSLPVYEVASFGASGSSAIFRCSGKAGSSLLTCDQPQTDFRAGQGIRIVGGGAVVQTPPPMNVTVTSSSAAGGTANHSYCYIGMDADGLGGVSAPSQQACIEGPTALSLQSANLLAWDYNGPLAATLWYVSVDDSPYQFLCAGCNTDVGQRPASADGWPSSLPPGAQGIAKNEDLFDTCAAASGNQLVLTEPLAADVLDAVVDHDDTASVQAAIDQASAAGGGTIQFEAASYNIRRPSWIYVENNSVAYPHYTTSYAMAPWWDGYSLLYIQNGSTGHIAIEGRGTSTVIVTPPGHAYTGALIAIGGFGRPSTAPYTTLPMLEVAKGAQTVTLQADAAASGLIVGDDIWLFSGSYSSTSTPCIATDGTAGGMCHYSELNTIKAIDGNTISLMYPASKRYYDDGSSSFGLVKMPITPHNVSIEHLSVNTSDPITTTGLVYGLVINDVHINGTISHGPFGGGFKRDVLIENSSWTFGAGDASWQATDEYDQFTNLAFVNNVISGYAAPGAEGPSMMARIYMTEGSSQVILQNNDFENASVYFQETTGDIITGNTFHNAVLNIPSAYDPSNTGFIYNYIQDSGFLSFASQDALNVANNTFTIDSTFDPPFVINVGHFSAAAVSGNTINYNSTSSAPLIVSRGGAVTGNNIVVGPSRNSYGIVGVPDQGPGIEASSIEIDHNSIVGANMSAGIVVPDPGFQDTAPVCLFDNSVSVSNGQPMETSTASVNFGCISGAD